MKNKAVEKLVNEFESFVEDLRSDSSNNEIKCKKYETKILIELLAEKIKESDIKETFFKDNTEESTIVSGGILASSIFIIEGIKVFLSKDENEIINRKMVLGNFSLLCSIMEILNFKMKEKVDVIFYIINRNINLIKSANNTGHINFSIDNVLNIEDEDFNITEFLEIAATKGFGKTLNNRFYRLTSNGKREKLLLEKFMFFSIKWSKDFLEQMETIHLECILEKESYSLEKVDEIYQTFINLGIDKNICDYLKQKMLEDMKNRELSKVSASSFVTVKKQDTKTINDKKYRELIKNIRNYFDFYKMQLVKEDITYEEIIECATKAHLVGISDEQIKTFFAISDLSEKMSKEASIAMYIELYNKLEFYREKLEIGDNLDTMKEILQEMVIADDESYLEWKNMFLEILQETLRKIEGRYDYELSLVKGL